MNLIHQQIQNPLYWAKFLHCNDRISVNMDWNISQLKRGSSRSCIEKIPMLIHITWYKHLWMCTFFSESIYIYQTPLRPYIFIRIYITLNIQKIKPAIATHCILSYTNTSMRIRNIYLCSCGMPISTCASVWLVVCTPAYTSTVEIYNDKD